jgi:hypothetical protein
MSSTTDLRITALEARVALLESQIASSNGSAPVKASKTEGGSKRAAKTPREPREKSAAQTEWNAFVDQTIQDMRENGWASWTSLTDGTVFPASELKTLTGKDGATREAHVFSSGSLAGKEASRAAGGLARASFLQLEDDPEAAAKKRASREKRLTKVAENASKKSSSKSSTGSADDAEPVADDVSAPAPAESTKPKKVLSAEHLAKMKAGREAKKAEKLAAANTSVVAEVVPAPAPAPVANVVVSAEPKAKKAVKKAAPAPAPVVAKTYDLNFEPWEHDGAEYIKNERGDVLTFPDADWVGRWNGASIDASVARPTDIDAYLE